MPRKPPKYRDTNIKTMLGRKPGPMKDRRQEKGGAKNEMEEYMEETDIEGELLDKVVYYRNLAIMLGAKPNQMLNNYDYWLVQTWRNDDDGGFSEWVQEIQEEWAAKGR